MTEGNYVIADLTRNPENERKTGYCIKCSMTEGNYVIADLIRNPENERKNWILYQVQYDRRKPCHCGLDPQSREGTQELDTASSAV
jgi:hypothetical protein